MTILNITTIWAIKAAFLVFYWNLATRGGHYPKKTIRYALHTTAVTLFVTYIVEVVILLTLCRPLSLSWYFASAFDLSYPNCYKGPQ
jgi:hypothetical protein